MTAAEDLTPKEAERAREVWLEAAKSAVTYAAHLESIGVHKQVANRILEPWMHMTTLVTATDFENFFALRVHKAAQPDFQNLAHMMLKAYLASEPQKLQPGQWHIPFGDKHHDIEDSEVILRVATGRCARVSYKNQDGNYIINDDLAIYRRLVDSYPGHWSPVEHCCMCRDDDEYQKSNFRGWTQLRKMYTSKENITGIDLHKLLVDYEASIA